MLFDNLRTMAASAGSATPASTGFNVTGAYDIADVIRTGIAILVLASGMLCVFYILWGGVMLILSGGKEEKIKPAISSIRFSVIGLLVIILSLFVLPKLGDLMGLNVSRYISPAVVFSTIKVLAAKLFGSTEGYGSAIDSGKPVLPSDFSDL